MATNPFERLSEQRPNIPESSPEPVSKPIEQPVERKKGPSNPDFNARQFLAIVGVQYGEQLEGLSDNPTDREMDGIVNEFVGKCRDGTILDPKREKPAPLKEDMLTALTSAQQQENRKENILRMAPGTSKMSRFLAKAKLGIETQVTSI